MAVTILPTRWRAAIGRGDLSLAAAEAAATTATGWPPDDWTAMVLARHTDTTAEHTRSDADGRR